MRPVTLSELEVPLAATLHGEDREVRGVSTDSRHLCEGDLFVALCGEHFDGHDYITEVERSGAAALLVSTPVTAALPQLRVEDTQRALGRLGGYNRQMYNGPLVAITGSSGKTTVKNMVHSVLSRRGETLATQGNFNNEIGVPLTLLRLQPATEYAVVEMGAARAGDIAWLCELGRPTIALLLNAMPAHLEGFGSVDDVATAKGEIFDALGAADFAIINADQPWAKQWRKRADAAAILDFGLKHPAAISARDIQTRGVEGVSFTVSTPRGDIAMRLSLPGIHNVANALAATAVGLACDVPLADVRDGLEALRTKPGRLHAQRVSSGAVVVDDCYNANPGSVRAAIDLLADSAGRRTLMLGAMRELGADSETLHREIGAYAMSAGIDSLWGVGPELRSCVQAFGRGGHYFDDREQAIASLQGQFSAGDVVLVKGSRSAGMEKVVAALQSELAEAEG